MFLQKVAYTLIGGKQNKRKDEKMKKIKLTDSQILEICNTLEKLVTREEGAELLKEACKSKEDLNRISKHLDLSIRTNTTEQLVERIIENTIGYQLRSAAIQGISLK